MSSENTQRDNQQVLESDPSAYRGSPSPRLSHEDSKRFCTLNQEQLDFLSSIPVKCFCNSPAHEVYTSEYGPIYECASYRYDNVSTSSQFKHRFICGFHIHERPWEKLVKRAQHEQTFDLENSFLRSCPQFNFTICTIFKVGNSYPLSPPVELSDCFCHHTILMRITPEGSIRFTCMNVSVEGAKKCGFSLPSREVAYPKPNSRLHALISEEHYLTQRQQKREELTSKHHLSHATARLLASLSDHFDKHQQNTKYKMIPTNVMAQQAKKTSCIGARNQDNTMEDDCGQWKETHERMLHLLAEKKKSDMESAALDAVSVESQEVLSSKELGMAYLKAENKRLLKEKELGEAKIIKFKTGQQKDIPSVCIACNVRPSEFCVIPCFHYGYCEACGVKLPKCVICNLLIKDYVRVFRR